MLLGSIPQKLDRQHEKAWVLLTFPTCTQLIYSLQSHSRLTQPSVSPVPSPLTTSSFSPPSDDIHCQVCQSPFNEHQMLLCDMCDAAWYVVCLLRPLTTIPHGIWKCPLCLLRNLLPQPATLHLHLPSPILDFDFDQKNDSQPLIHVSGLPITIYQKKYTKKNVFPNTPTRIAEPHKYARLFMRG